MLIKLNDESCRTSSMLTLINGVIAQLAFGKGHFYSARYAKRFWPKFYLNTDGRNLWSAMVKPDRCNFEEPTKVLDLPANTHTGFGFCKIAPDGERFLMPQKVESEASTNQFARRTVLVVQNWLV